MEDVECQEYAAFSLAHLASNRENQVKLVNMGVVKPLVAMLSSDAEPKHYAGLALLKLADNFENHLKIAEQGGIQALLRLGRTRSTDDQLQYKAALTLGQLASNAVKLLPSNRPGSSGGAVGNGGGKMSGTAGTDGGGTTRLSRTVGAAGTEEDQGAGAGGAPGPLIGTGSRVMNRLRSQVASQKDRAKDMTIEYLDRSLAQTQQERMLQQKSQNAKDLRDLKGTDDLNAAGAAAGAGVSSKTGGKSGGNTAVSRSLDQGNEKLIA
jgi:hypothetical protein